MTSRKIRLYNPVYRAKPDPSFFRPKQIPDLKGKSVVILDNGWWIWEQTLPTLVDALSKRYGVAKTTIYKYERVGPPPEGIGKSGKGGGLRHRLPCRVWPGGTGSFGECHRTGQSRSAYGLHCS